MMHDVRNLQDWPKDWPRHKQACYASWDDCCDVLVGPCRCGAWHQEGEFTYEDGVLRRYGEIVPTKNGQPR